MTSRVGIFFLVIGLIALVIFFASNPLQNTQLSYCCGGLFAVLLGGFLLWRGYEAPPPSGRFKTFRKLQSKKDKKGE